MTRKETLSRLAAALHDKTLVRIKRSFGKWGDDGYVVDIGPRFLMIASVGNGIWLDGYQCFRLADIRELRIPAPNSKFQEDALKKRGERLGKRPRISLDSLAALLRTANAAFPLVTIHREMLYRNECYIGRVVNVNRTHVSMREIMPNAHWESWTEKYRLSEITRVDFGGGYEDALHLVGGSPPKQRRSRVKKS